LASQFARRIGLDDEVAAALSQTYEQWNAKGRLDGMLLAITMAAGRHRSLAATVKWSCWLLDDHERRVFGWCR
jgi:hypothetical protein